MAKPSTLTLSAGYNFLWQISHVGSALAAWPVRSASIFGLIDNSSRNCARCFSSACVSRLAASRRCGAGGERGLGGERTRVVHGGLDSAAGEVRAHAFPLGHAHDVVVDGVGGVAREAPHAVREGGVVARGEGAPTRHPRRQVREVGEEDGGLEGVESRVGADHSVDILVKMRRDEAVVRESTDTFREVGVVGEDDTCVPRGAEGLRREKLAAPMRPVRAGGSAPMACARSSTTGTGSAGSTQRAP
jgi:hypothetical protein